MATEEQVSRFVNAFLKISENVRKLGVYNDDMSRQLCVLQGIGKFEEENGRRMTITDVSKITGMALSNVSRFLRPLEEKGLVERSKEGRTTYLNITEDGKRLFAEKISDVRGILHQMLGALSEEDTEAFLTCSEKLSAELENITMQNN